MGGAVEKGLKKVASVATFSVSNWIGQQLNPDMPELPNNGKPSVAPVPDDAGKKIANRRKAAARKKGGRAGTMLSDTSKLG